MTRIGSMGYALANETHKAILHHWSYRANLLFDTVLFAVGFIGLGVWMGDGDTLRLESRESYFLAFLVWYFCLAAINTMTWSVREETVTGTLEQMAMGTYPLSMLILGRSLARFVVTCIQVAFIGGALALIMNISVRLPIETVPVFVLTICGVYGFAYMLGGVTIVFKRVVSVAELLPTLVIINGTFVSVDKFPAWLEGVARILPTTQGIIVLRKIAFENYTLVDTWSDGSLVFLTVHSLVAFVLGMLIFQSCEQIAKHRGTLGQY